MIFVQRSMTLGILLIILSACGGGGSDHNGGAEGDDAGQEPDIPVASLTLNLTDDSNSREIKSIGSGRFDEISVDESNPILIDLEQTSVVTAIGEQDQVRFLTTIDSSSTGITLNGKSTVRTLLGMVPSLSEALSEDPSIFDTSLVHLDGIRELVEYIDLNANWSDDSPEFMSLLIAALQEATNTIIDTESFTAVRSSSETLSPRVSQRITPRLVHIDDTDANEEITESGEDPGEIAERSYSQSGVVVSAKSVSEEHIALELENRYRRWVVVIVGENPRYSQGDLSIDFENVFLIPGDGALNVLKGKTETALITTESILSPEVNLSDYGVYAYGLGVGVPDGTIPGTAYAIAGSYTVLFELAIPLMKKVTGAKRCVDDILRPRFYRSEGDNLVKKLAKSLVLDRQIRDYMENGKLDLIALKFGELIASEMNKVAIGCVSEAITKQLSRLIPIVGQLATAIEALEETVKAGVLATQIGFSEPEVFWHLENSSDTEIYLEGENSDRQAKGSTYHTEAELNGLDQQWRDLYSGQCDSEFDRCDGFYYHYILEKDVAFTLRCLSPVDKSVIACKDAEFFYRKVNSNESYKSEIVTSVNNTVYHRHSFEEPGEYEGYFLVHDHEGGAGLSRFTLQIKEQFPHTLPTYEGSNLAYTIIDEKMIINTVIIGYQERDGTITKTFSLRNEGSASSMVVDIDVIKGQNLIQVDAPVDRNIDPGERLDFNVTYTVPKDVLTAEYATISLSSGGAGNLLGGDSISEQKDNGMIYDIIELPLKFTSQDIDLIGDWQLSYLSPPSGCSSLYEDCLVIYQNNWFTVVEEGVETTNNFSNIVLNNDDVTETYPFILTNTPISLITGTGEIHIDIPGFSNLTYTFRYNDINQTDFESYTGSFKLQLRRL